MISDDLHGQGDRRHDPRPRPRFRRGFRHRQLGGAPAVKESATSVPRCTPSASRVTVPGSGGGRASTPGPACAERLAGDGEAQMSRPRRRPTSRNRWLASRTTRAGRSCDVVVEPGSSRPCRRSAPAAGWARSARSARAAGLPAISAAFAITSAQAASAVITVTATTSDWAGAPVAGSIRSSASASGPSQRGRSSCWWPARRRRGSGVMRLPSYGCQRDGPCAADRTVADDPDVAA